MAATTLASNAQIEEVTEVKTNYGAACRVLKDIGEFTHVVDIKLLHTDLSIKFQLEAQYPDIAPHIILRSSKILPDSKEKLALFLTSEANLKVGTKMLSELVKATNSWLTQNEVDVIVDDAPQKGKKGEKKGKKKTRSKHKSGESEEDILFEKKSSMKTAEDVISRILWDASLPSEEFVIGYVDRFVGIVEKAFTAFSWEDLASVDYNTLAIPKHRIEYFKYKKVMVWEKKTRMDNVFGSTGGGMTIHAVIEKYENGESKKAARETMDDYGKQNVDDEDSEDDDVVINVGNQEDEEGDSDNENEEGATYRGSRMTKDEYFGAKPKPTHFLALRVTDPQVAASILEAQDLICNINRDYHECLIPVERLHVTLACLGLDTPEQTQQAVGVLKELQADLASWNPRDIEITLKGTGQFYHNVLYGQVHCEQRFMDFVQHLRKSIQAGGVEIRDIYDFNPHMTILKLDSVFKAKTKTRYLDVRLYELLKDKVLGQQVVDSIHLCEMSKSRQEDGFYTSFGTVTF